MAERPRTYSYKPPPGVPRSNLRYETHTVPIHDARPVADTLSLDSEGFALIEHRSDVRDFYDETQLRRVYHPEAEQVVAARTGGSRVMVFDHTIRRRTHGVKDRTPDIPLQQPAMRTHGDYTDSPVRSASVT